MFDRVMCDLTMLHWVLTVRMMSGLKTDCRRMADQFDHLVDDSHDELRPVDADIGKRIFFAVNRRGHQAPVSTIAPEPAGLRWLAAFRSAQMNYSWHLGFGFRFHSPRFVVWSRLSFDPPAIQTRYLNGLVRVGAWMHRQTARKDSGFAQKHQHHLHFVHRRFCHYHHFLDSRLGHLLDSRPHSRPHFRQRIRSNRWNSIGLAGRLMDCLMDWIGANFAASVPVGQQ